MIADEKKIFYMYDEIMLLHEDYDGHPEKPLRIKAIHDHLKEVGLLEQMMKLEPVSSSIKVRDDGTVQYPAFETVHDEENMKEIEHIVGKIEERDNYSDPYESLYYCPDTFKSAKVAADSALSAVCEVLDNESPRERGFCIIRPPGHHAYMDHHRGFCFINNVALAAELAVSQGKKVLIFDWDIH